MKIVSQEEEIGYDVVATVVSQTGYCGAGYNVGDEIRFCGHAVEGKTCIIALYSFLPRVFAFKYGAEFPWAEDKDVSLNACPDSHNPVVFEIRRHQERYQKDH
jgi:uncharacterized repeat protein (TIGR04076 family)